ncbi:MAG TPA: hypothetical protein VEN78_25705, partial [Bradyrhizobium sp.]|nr:hypothetical protein [Bradyrhizobium sp.]
MDDAIELLPPAKLHKIAKKYLDLKRLRPDAEKATKPSLLTDVKRFEKASSLAITAMAATRCLRSLAEQQRR